MHWISVRFYEMGDMLYSFLVTLTVYPEKIYYRDHWRAPKITGELD